jgi:ubiquinone/menaquinone biosynthesis C-methylase UbiE
MSFVGIDISQRMIEHACAQAKAHQVNERVEFQVMDALRPFELPVASFDLVNLRFGSSYVRTWDWPKVVNEMLRVASYLEHTHRLGQQARPQSQQPWW